jgi:hypothetical protein
MVQIVFTHLCHHAGTQCSVFFINLLTHCSIFVRVHCSFVSGELDYGFNLPDGDLVIADWIEITLKVHLISLN